MLRAAFLFSALAICSATSGDAPEPAEKVVFQDRFSGKLADGWTWVRETPGSLTRAVAGSMVGKSWHVFKDGLVFRVLPGYLHARENNSSNILLRPVPDTDQPLAIEVALRSEPTVPYEHAGLVWYYDDDHYVALFREFLGIKPQMLMVTEKRAAPTFHYGGVYEGKNILLRLEVSGNKITGKFRGPGEEWRTIGHSTLPVPARQRKARVGLHTGGAAPGAGHFARFWDFRILEMTNETDQKAKNKNGSDKEKN